MSLEERAKAFGLEIFPKSDIENIPNRNGEYFNYDNERKNNELLYIRIATDQRKIDIDKALKVYEDLMTCSGFFPETITTELARMRNKLED